MIIIGVKEKILKLIVENDGLSYNNIATKYKDEYNTELNKKTGYKFLQRLKNEKMIISESQTEKDTKTKQYIYKATAKGKSHQPDDFEYLKSLFEEGKVRIYGNKLSSDDTERLEMI